MCYSETPLLEKKKLEVGAAKGTSGDPSGCQFPLEDAAAARQSQLFFDCRTIVSDIVFFFIIALLSNLIIFIYIVLCNNVIRLPI